MDTRTCEKVAEIAISGMSPHKFAILVIAVARYFKGASGRGAFVIWEGNGPGVPFGSTVLSAGYTNFYCRKKSHRRIGGGYSDIPGWWTTPESKLELLGNYRRAIQNGDFTNRSAQAIKECRFYIHLQGGKVCHSRSARSADPTGAGENHGDRVIADALANHVLKIVQTRRFQEQGGEQASIPVGSFAYRQQRRREQAAQIGDLVY